MQCEQFEKMMTLLSQVARPRLFTCIACPQVIVADKSFHKTDPPVCLPYNIILLRQSSRIVCRLTGHGIAIYNVAQSGCKAVQSNILSASTSAESATSAAHAMHAMQCPELNPLYVLSHTIKPIIFISCEIYETKRCISTSSTNPSSSSVG